VALDREVTRLTQIEIIQPRLSVRQCDLKDTSQVEAVFHWLEEDSGLRPVNVLVNNAGVGGVRGILDSNPAEWLPMVQTNLLGPTLCSKLAVTSIEAEASRKGVKTQGHIINILSVWAHEVPKREYTHFYSATKHALRVVSECLRLELQARQLNIKVTNICPGPVETNFNRNSCETEEEAQQTFGSTGGGYVRLSPKEVADTVLMAVTTPSNLQINDILLTPAGYCTK